MVCEDSGVLVREGGILMSIHWLFRLVSHWGDTLMPDCLIDLEEHSIKIVFSWRPGLINLLVRVFGVGALVWCMSSHAEVGGLPSCSSRRPLWVSCIYLKCCIWSVLFSDRELLNCTCHVTCSLKIGAYVVPMWTGTNKQSRGINLY